MRAAFAALALGLVLIAAGCGGTAAKLQSIRICRFVFRSGRLAFLEIEFQSFLFFEQIT